MPDFAERLAHVLGLRFVDVCERLMSEPEAKKVWPTATQQARNLDGALEIIAEPLPPASVFLVDDLINSQWEL